MKILLTGANGFIGGHIQAALLAAGHQVIAAVRRPERLATSPNLSVIAADMNRDLDVDIWKKRLRDVDAVVNCAGILHARRGQSLWRIHKESPIALFQACQDLKIRKIVQISAIGAEAPTDYAASKKAADDYLQSTGLDWTILRPSLVYAEGSYGGTSMLRAMAACPFRIPVIGKGTYQFTPIHAADLARCVLDCLQRPNLNHLILEPGGPETMTMTGLLKKLRRWMGFGDAKTLSIPEFLVRFGAYIGDRVGAGPLTSTSLKQLEFGTEADGSLFTQQMGWQARSLDQSLYQNPAQVQDRLQARLYGLRPIISSVLILLWLISGILGFIAPDSFVRPYLEAFNLPANWLPWIGPVTGMMDLGLALAILLRWKIRITGLVQLGLVSSYTIGITFANLGIWLDPFGAILKNLPILVLILVWIAVEDER